MKLIIRAFHWKLDTLSDVHKNGLTLRGESEGKEIGICRCFFISLFSAHSFPFSVELAAL